MNFIMDMNVRNNYVINVFIVVIMCSAVAEKTRDAPCSGTVHNGAI